MAVAGTAFKGWRTGVSRVTIRGLVIEKFANPAGIGAVNGRPTWRVIGNTIRLNHGIGVQDASLIRDNRIVRNGQLGIMVSFGSHVLIERNTIVANNSAGFDNGWEAGGVKFVRSSHVLLRRNTVVGNDGPGLWSDGDGIHITYEKNLITGNSGPGILHEISYDAVIRGNVVKRNGFGAAGWIDGSGILLSASGRVKISNNIVSRNRDGIGITQTDRGSGTYGPYEAQNNLVVGNVITMPHGHSGLVKNVGDDSYFTTKQNVFARNTYYLGCDKQYFAWRDPSGNEDYVYMTRKQWQSAGNDRNGHFRSIC
jgi:parallel beta-helix repeat protein